MARPGLRWLGRPEPDIAEVKASVERMIANGRRASEVVARLRALARRGEPVQAPVDVNEMIDEVLPLVERERSERGVTLELALAQQLPVVLGDRVQLQQVALNLALNAIQAMAGMNERRRRLWIVTRPGACEQGDAVLIEVRDNGPGVDDDSLAKLFNAFYTTKKDGMGMGLSISRSIIEAHGGKITAALHAEGGMLFTIMLPVPKERLP